MIDLSLSLVYDKTLRTVLKAVSSLLYPMSNNSGGKSRGKGRGRNRSKAKQKAAVHQLKGYRSLLVLMVITGVFCILGSGEASWFGPNTDSEATTESVNDLLDDGAVEGVSIEVC